MFGVYHKLPKYNPPLPPTSGWSGGTLDIPWTYSGTIDHAQIPVLEQASLSKSVSGSLFPVGATTVNCTATDASGNPSVSSFTVTRSPLSFTGFLSPVGGADLTGGNYASPVRTFKMGSTIPVKFSASCGGSPVLAGVHRLQVIKYTNATTSGDPVDATPQDSATAGDQFRVSEGQWIFNLDTKGTGMSTGIWLLRATLSDCSQHAAWIQLK